MVRLLKRTSSALQDVWGWIWDHPYAISVVVLCVAMFASFWVDTQQDRRERREDAIERVEQAEHDALTECRAANAGRATIREIGVQLSIANADALIAVVPDAEPAVVERYRIEAQARAERTVASLGERNCPAEAEEAREVVAQIEGVEP